MRRYSFQGGLRIKAWATFLLLAAGLMLVGCKEPKLPSPFVASDVSHQYAQADFRLNDAQGRLLTLADFKDKVVVLFFGYTHCPDVCPTTLADLAQAMSLLGAEAARVQVLFVTLDPERDTAELLGQYVPAFHPSFMGLRGDAASTRQAAEAFGVSWRKQPGQGGSYTLDHTAGSYLIDPPGRRVLRAPYGQPAAQLVQDLRLLLALQKPS
jgi:protein SCO1/2